MRQLTKADRIFLDARKGLGPAGSAYWSAVEKHYTAGKNWAAATDAVRREKPDIFNAYIDERHRVQRALG